MSSLNPFEVVAGIFSISQSIKAGRLAKEQGELGAEAERVATAEEIRRLEKRRTILIGQQFLATARNMVDVNSASALAVRQDTQSEFNSERAVIERLGASRAKASLLAGSITRTSAYAQAGGTAASLAGNIFDALQTPPGTG